MSKHFRDPRHDKVIAFAPDGKAHSMTTINAQDLVRTHGWRIATGEEVDAIHKTLADLQAASQTAIPPLPPVVVPPSDPKAPTAPETGEESENSEHHAPTWDDLPALLGKDLLRKAAGKMGVDIDGRANEKRIVAAIDTALDARLTASGDTDGAVVPETDDSDYVVVAKETALAERRVRAFTLEASRLEIAFETVPAFVMAVATQPA